MRGSAPPAEQLWTRALGIALMKREAMKFEDAATPEMAKTAAQEER